MRIIKLTAFVLVLMLFLSACGESSEGRLNYNYDMSRYVTLDSYELELDSNSEMYQYFFNGYLREVMTYTVNEGKVEEGQTVNIDYVGKMNGEEFEGGSDSGYDLEIGSDSFIEGFEDGLIGCEVGSTTELALTFPSDYDAAQLAGKAVTFTVKINHIKVSLDRVNDETAVKCGFDSAAEVMDLAKTYAVENCVWEEITEKAEIGELPEKENKMLLREQINSYERTANGQGMTLTEYADENGMTLSELSDYVYESFVPTMANGYALAYYIFDAEGYELNDTVIEETKKELDGIAGTDVYSLGISKEFIEAEAVKGIALKIVTEKATVK